MTARIVLAAALWAGLLSGQKAEENPGDGSTPVHWAAFRDDLPAAKKLIAAGADVKATTRIGGITPLAMAAKNGSAPMLELLLQAGANPNSANEQGTTVLMTASASGNVDAIKLLLDRGAEVNALENAHGQTALMFAAALNRAPAVKLLLARGANPNVITRITRFERIRLDMDGNPIPADAAPKALKTAPPAPEPPPPAADDWKGQAALLQATVQKLTARLEQLEHPGAKASEVPEPARGGEVIGGGGGRAGDVAFLGPREVGSTVSGGLSALLFAAREGHLETAKELVAAGANINQVSQSERASPLIMAIVNGHLTLAKYLLDCGAAPNLSTSGGLTPLYAAIDVQWAPHAWFPQPNLSQERVSYLALAKALLEHGANPNAKLEKKLWFRGLSQDPTWVDPAGATAFWRAAQSSDVEAMRLLVAHGADPYLASTGGDTPLMVAAGIGWMANHSANSPGEWLNAVKYCVELGGDVNAVDARGYTPLHGAAYLGMNDMVTYLVDRGARVDVKTKAGDTVADLANGPTRFGIPHPETVALLEKLGSANSHNCRSDQCLVAPKEEKKDAKPAPVVPVSAVRKN